MSVECSLDRKKYHPNTINIFQLIAAHMTDIFYNYLYVEGKKLKEQGRSESITRGFQLRMYAFVKSLDAKAKNYKPERFLDFLEGINRYFQLYTVYETLSISDCINKIVHELVPQDFYDQLGKDQKRDILYSALFSCLNKFATTIAQEYCGLVVDDHSNVENIEILKELAVDLLIKERHEMYKKFLDTANTGKKSADTVDGHMARQMQRELHALYKKRDEWEKERTELTTKIKQLQASVDEKQQIAMDLLEKYRAARTHLQQLQRGAQLTASSVVVKNAAPTRPEPAPKTDAYESFGVQHRPLSEVLKQEPVPKKPAAKKSETEHNRSVSKPEIEYSKPALAKDQQRDQTSKPIQNAKDLQSDQTSKPEPMNNPVPTSKAEPSQNTKDSQTTLQDTSDLDKEIAALDSDRDTDQDTEEPPVPAIPVDVSDHGSDDLPGADDLLADYF